MKYAIRVCAGILLLTAAVESYGHEWTEEECLAKNLYYEARGEGVPGMVAVANVVLRRVASNAFPDTVCGVVMQDGQFSWYRAGAHYSPQGDAYQRALTVAQNVMSVWKITYFEGALYYMNPKKASRDGKRFFAKLKPLGKLGNHVFYR